MTVYASRTPTRQDFNDAQGVLDTHVVSSATGRCLHCAQPGPCTERENAVALISRTIWLPVRRPLASRPALIGSRRVA